MSSSPIKSSIFIGSVTLALTLLGWLPQIDALLNFGNMTWLSSHVYGVTAFGCFFSAFNFLAVVIAIIKFKACRITAVFCILLCAINIYVSWRDLITFLTPWPNEEFWSRIGYEISTFWSFDDFFRMTAVFVVAPTLVYIGLRMGIAWLIKRVN